MKIWIEDAEEVHAPAEMEVLGLELVGDVVFISALLASETHDSFTYTQQSLVTVKLDVLLGSLATMIVERDARRKARTSQ
jgi:hypothetical protein